MPGRLPRSRNAGRETVPAPAPSAVESPRSGSRCPYRRIVRSRLPGKPPRVRQACQGNTAQRGRQDQEAQMSDVNAAAPAGDVYDWYTRGMRLLGSGDAAAAAALLEHAARAEPASCSVREALARALFDSGRYADARAAFAANVDESPADDYAQFGLGLSQMRMGELDEAVEHLAIAVALRPENHHYGTALRSARAARARG